MFSSRRWNILRDTPGAPMERWINEIPNDGLIRFTIAFNAERLLLTSPAVLSEVMVKNVDDWEKPKQLRESLAIVLGNSLVVAEGDDHRVQRKNMLPAFSYRHIKEAYPIFWKKSCEFVEAIGDQITKESSKNGAHLDGVPISFPDFLRRVTLDNIGEAGFGYRFNAITEPESAVNKTYESLFNTSETGVVLTFLETLENILPVSWLQRLPLEHNRQTHAAISYIRHIIKGLIDDKHNRTNETPDHIGTDIMSVAVKSGLFTDDALVDQTMTFLAAGHETVSTAMSWALVMLCKYPKMQQRLRDEIRTGIPSPYQHPSGASDTDVLALPYLQAFCNEILRFHPPVPITRRAAVRDTILGGHRIPKGTNVLLVPAAVNKSKELWGDDALVFNPERWLGGDRASSGGATSNYSNLTFLHGPRSCIGATFARAEFACILAVFVGRVEISHLQSDNQKIKTFKGGITHRLQDELRLKARIVDGW
ncbi:hypothetical protein RRF57_013178 [Xylaria bambusicola]|uniref:Cytochrome P450 n=1 Tax=Xylaria bambusicola TaxID=326684 RepID=A0AAN7ZBA7_9PEZI